MNSTARVMLPLASALLALTLGATLATAGTATPVVAVFSKTMNGYTRTLGPDNRPNPETYAFAAGGRLDATYDDPSINYLKFSQIAGVVAASLKRQGYVASVDPKTTKLLIFVYWGTTQGYDDEGGGSTIGSDYKTALNKTDLGPANSSSGLVNTQTIMNDAANFALDGALNEIAFFNEGRDRLDRFNANVLGYEQARNETNFLRPYSVTARDILSEVEESRYFVVLKAYDFQTLRDQKKKVQLWETRYSIAKHGVRFDEQLVDMTRFASQFCGQNVDRLIRRHIREGRVEVGTPVEVSTPAKPADR